MAAKMTEDHAAATFLDVVTIAFFVVSRSTASLLVFYFQKPTMILPIMLTSQVSPYQTEKLMSGQISYLLTLRIKLLILIY
jgi:hypothetical protein